MRFSEEPRPDLLDLSLEFNRRPAHWTSHRDGTHTQSTDLINTIADLIAMPLNDSNEQDAAA